MFIECIQHKAVNRPMQQGWMACTLFRGAGLRGPDRALLLIMLRLLCVILLFSSCAADTTEPAQRPASATTAEARTSTLTPPPSGSVTTPPRTAVDAVEERAPGTANPAADPESAQAAAAVIDTYYRAIASRDYDRAYSLWAGDGPSGQTREAFARGFAETASVTVATGTPSPIGAAAGSRYVEIPVTVTAKTTAGRTQRFTGTYTLRRSVVDGASAAQRTWHIYGASLKAAPRRPSKVRTE
jgi:hypothetical protein